MPVRQLSYPGPPVRGTYSLGDVLVDPQGITYICTTAGTPGRWAMQSLSGPAQPIPPRYTFNVKRDFGAKGDGVTDDTAAIQAAVSAAMPDGAVMFPPGQYLISSPIVIQNPDSAATQPARVPFLYADTPPAAIGDSSGQRSAVEIVCSDTFPVGQFALQFLGPNATYAPAGGGCKNIDVVCNDRGAGILVHQPRRMVFENLCIRRTAVPAAPADQPFGMEPLGAFSVEQSNGTASAYNRFVNVCVAYAGRRSFDYNTTGKDSFFGCYSLDPVSENYVIGGMSSWYGCQYSGGEVGWSISTNEALISGSKIAVGTLVSSGGDVNAVLIYAMGTADGGVGLVMFEGCRFQSNPPSGGTSGDALLLVQPNTGRTINARFSGCTWNAYGNQSTVTVPYFAYIASGVEGKVEIDGGVIAGTPAIGTFVDDSGNNVLSVHNVQGFNPLTVATPSVPAASTTISNSTVVDCDVYITGGAGGDTSVNGTATGVGNGTFFVPAGGTIDLGAYTTAPTWVWVGR